MIENKGLELSNCGYDQAEINCAVRGSYHLQSNRLERKYFNLYERFLEPCDSMQTSTRNSKIKWA